MLLGKPIANLLASWLRIVDGFDQQHRPKVSFPCFPDCLHALHLEASFGLLLLVIHSSIDARSKQTQQVVLRFGLHIPLLWDK